MEIKKEKIGILGGSFNPPHIAHLKIASECLKENLVDEVYFMPVFIQPFKQELKTLNPYDRLKMTNILKKENKNFGVIDYEIKSEGISYTYKTLSAVKDFEEFKDKEIYFILGHDTFKEIRLWYESEKLLSEFSFIIAKRKTNESFDELKFIEGIKKDYGTKILLLENDFIDISSTSIRDYLNKRNYDEVKKIVPKNIFNYIKKNNLYND